MNIDEMPAGREIDALVGEIMGWEAIPTSFQKEWQAALWRDPDGLLCLRDDSDGLPLFSFYIANAWSAVEHILVHDKRLLQFRAEIAGGGKYQYAKFVDCGDNSVPVYGACAASMSLAICRAALKVARSNQ